MKDIPPQETGPRPTEQLVAYQDDSIVSRIIIKSSGGSVTAFAFSTGQELSEHTVPYDAFVQVLDGEAEIRIAGEPHLVGTGESIVLPANQPHAVKAHRSFKMLLSMVRT